MSETDFDRNMIRFLTCVVCVGFICAAAVGIFAPKEPSADVERRLTALEERLEQLGPPTVKPIMCWHEYVYRYFEQPFAEWPTEEQIAACWERSRDFPSHAACCLTIDRLQAQLGLEEHPAHEPEKED